MSIENVCMIMILHQSNELLRHLATAALVLKKDLPRAHPRHFGLAFASMRRHDSLRVIFSGWLPFPPFFPV